MVDPHVGRQPARLIPLMVRYTYGLVPLVSECGWPTTDFTF